MRPLDKNFFYSAKIGFEFEFYSKFSREEIAKSLGENLGKKIKVFKRYHSSFSPTSDIYKLESDFSGGVKMVELVTGPMNYYEAIPILIRVLKWIDTYGWTDEKCAFQFGLSFDRAKYPLITDFRNLNPLKFVLGFDEQFIWDRFPDRKGSLYAKSIKRITPINKFLKSGKDIIIDKNSYSVHTEKNMGINLLKLEEGYMEVRYLGGKDYQKKYVQIKEIMDYIVEYTFNTLVNNDSFTPNDISTLRNIMSDVYKSSQTFIDADSLIENYPDFHVLVDLKEDMQILKSYFSVIRDVLFDLIVENDVTSGYLNYDTQISKFQLKDANTEKANLLRDIDIVDCVIKGNVSNCRLFGCILDNCQVEDSSFVINNNVKDSKISFSDLNIGNFFENCYIDSKEKEINCEVKGGIIRSGYIGSLAEISEETEVVSDALDAKGKGDKMKGRSIFTDRNYVDVEKPVTGFADMNSNKKTTFLIDKWFRNKNF